MADISLDTIKALRDETGISVMQIKKALEEAGGDVEKARVLLRKASSAAASKKADRAFGAGVAQAYVHAGNTVASAIVLSCETDFVARNEEFVKLARDIAMHIAATAPKFISRDTVSENDTKAAREVFAAEVASVPEAAREKALQGKLDSYLRDFVLLEQPYIKDPGVTIKGLLEAATQKFGENIAITSFGRYSVK